MFDCCFTVSETSSFRNQRRWSLKIQNNLNFVEIIFDNEPWTKFEQNIFCVVWHEYELCCPYLRLRLSLCARAQIIELSELDLGEFQTSKFYENNWDVIIKTELEFGVDDESKTWNTKQIISIEFFFCTHLK